MQDIRRLISTKYIRFTAVLLLAAVFLFCFTGCSKTTSPKYGSLSGTVTLTNDTGNTALNPVDYSGVTVALYHRATLDTTIVRINGRHTNIGVQISQRTEFDHRLQNAILTASTDGAGNFTLSRITPGTYNLVVFKAGWGVRYVYNVPVAEGQNTVPASRENPSLQGNPSENRSGIVLYPVTELSGFVSENFVFQGSHNYLVTDNLTFTGSVVFSPGTQVWVNPAKRISFYANITTPDTDEDFVLVTTAYGMYGTSQHTASSIQKFYNLDCTTYAGFTNEQLSSVITTFTELGWNLKHSGLTVTNMIVRHMKTGLVFQQLTGVVVSHSNIVSSIDPELGGISLSACTNQTTSQLIVKDCTTGIRQHSSANVNVSNSYFYNSSISDIDNIYETTGSITQCTFEKSARAIATSGRSTTNVQYCLINTTVGLHNFHQLNWNQSWFTANFNNFYCSNYAVISTAVFNTVQLIQMNASNNYWGTANSSTIQQLIYDYYDLPAPDPVHPEYTIWAEVVFSPYRTVPVSGAGVSSN